MEKRTVQHIEFFHREHFRKYYYRSAATKDLAPFIDYFWETDFDLLWERYPEGFSDLPFPNVGYTFLINLGSPFTLQLEKDSFLIKNNGFLPRFKHMAAHHRPGNKLFGIKFNVAPLLLHKEVDFGDYKNAVYPLSYLLEAQVVAALKAATSFRQRVDILTTYYREQIRYPAKKDKRVEIITAIFQDLQERQQYAVTTGELAERYRISKRTLQRYFERVTIVSAKKALQLLRIRKAITSYIDRPAEFKGPLFGYYDYSHFYRDMMQFLGSHPAACITSHEELFSQDTNKLCNEGILPPTEQSVSS